MNAESVGEPTGKPKLASANGVSQGVAFEMLRSRRRRHVLHYLKQEGKPVDLYELSKQIASWENDVAPDAVSYEQRTRVYTALRQSHLPKMERAGIVDFDANGGIVELTGEAAELEVYLDVVPHEEIPWSKFYVGLSALCSGLVLATFLEIFPFSLLPAVGCAALIVFLFLGTSIAHWRHDRRNRIGTDGAPPI